MGLTERRGAIRLLWLIDSLTAGGAEALTLAFARAADPKRFRVTVACLKRLGGNPYETALREEGIPVVQLDARNLRDRKAFRHLLALIDEKGIDLIHAHLESASIWGAAAGRLRPRPVVTTFHTMPAQALPGRQRVRRRLRLMLVNRWAHRNLAVSEAALRAWLEAGLRRERAAVVHNGIDCTPFERAAADPAVRAALRDEIDVSAVAPLVATVSVLRPGKGLETLVESAPRLLARFPETRFAVAGEGPLADRLQRRAKELHVAHAFRWLGFRRDVAAVLAAADLFVLPSRDDAFPTALLESMAAGLPVVAGDAGGIPEIVEPGWTGNLVPPDDPILLADAVAGLVADPEARTTLAARARERVRERFSIAAWTGRLERVYREVLIEEGAG